MVRNLIVSHIQKEKELYIFVSIVFFIGLILGVVCINNIDNRFFREFKRIFF